MGARNGRKIKADDRGDDLFRIAVEAAPNAMIAADEDGKLVLANAQAEKLFGYSKAELLGKTIESLIPARFRTAHRGYRAGYHKKAETRAMGAGRDLFGLRKDGKEVPVEIGLNPVATQSGKLVLASIIDITERKNLERKLAHSETLASIGGMVAVVAHEIRNPLGSIVMAAKALARADMSKAERDEVMSILVSESGRLNATLGDFLQFARPREPKLRVGDINAAAHEILLAVKSDEAVAGKTTVHEELADLPPIPFDSDQIRQVLWNIIRNGFQALNGRGRLHVKTEAKESEIVVHIEDSGPGIPKEQLDKIFTPFFTTKSKGTGLGLPISRSIVIAHGGDIHVESSPGNGSRFSIVLPVAARNA